MDKALDQYSQFIHLSRYARWNESKKRRETWEETVERYISFFADKFGASVFPSKEIFDAVSSLKVMPSMRCLMTAGPALERDNAAGYNCTALAIEHPRAFDEILYLLMLGCFHEDTEIKTKTGNKKIKDITTEDWVLSFDESLKRYEFVKPELSGQVLNSKDKEKLELTFEDGSIVRCTDDHKFLTKNRGWIEAKDLTEEDEIQNYGELD